MRFDSITETFAHRLREVTEKLAREIRVVRHVGVEQVLEQGDLRVSEHHRKLRSREAVPAQTPLCDLRIGRKELDTSVQEIALLKQLHETVLEAEILRPAALGE